MGFLKFPLWPGVDVEDVLIVCAGAVVIVWDKLF